MDRIREWMTPATAAHAASVAVAAWVFYQYSRMEAPWFVLLVANLGFVVWSDRKEGGTDPRALHVAAAGFLLIAAASLVIGNYALTGLVALTICTVSQGLDWRHPRQRAPDPPAEDVTRP